MGDTNDDVLGINVIIGGKQSKIISLDYLLSYLIFANYYCD